MKESVSEEESEKKSSAWIVFAGIGLLFIIYGVYAFTLPYVEPTHWDDIAASGETVAYIADNFRWLGMLAFMAGILTLGTEYGGLRTASAWSWYVFLSFPMFFIFAIFFTWPGLIWTPFLLASVIALWITVPAGIQGE